MFDNKPEIRKDEGSEMAAARSALSQLAQISVTGATSAHLKQRAVGLSELQARLNAAQLHVLGELDSQKATDIEDGLQTISWLARNTNVTRPHAKQFVSVARKLRTTFSEFDAALTRGEITLDHATVYVAVASCPRVEQLMIDQQRFFLDLIKHCTLVEHWAAQLRAFVKRFDEDGSYNPQEDISINRLTWAKNFDGSVDFSGRFVGIRALRFEQTMQSDTQLMFEKFTEDHKNTPEIAVPLYPTLAALALDDLMRRGLAITPDGKVPLRPRAEITILVDKSKPAKAFVRNGLHPGTELSNAETSELTCDAVFNALVLKSLGSNGEGVSLNHGTDIRLATPKQRRAVTARDGGCVYGGCDAPPSWCELHHVEHWEHGGLSNLNNFAMLCSRHHGVVHREGWGMRAMPPDKNGDDDDPPHPHDVWFEMTTPRGLILKSQRHGKFQHAPVIGY